MARQGWTALQVTWADLSGADGRLQDLLLALDTAQGELEMDLLGGVEWDEDAAHVAAKTRRRIERLAAEVEEARRQRRVAERAYWAQVRLDRRQAANLVGVAPDTWSGYVSRGQAPAPGGWDDTGHPWWTELAVREWAAARPGQGRRPR